LSVKPKTLKRKKLPHWLPGLLVLLPSIGLIFYFVYVLLFRNFLLSLTNRKGINSTGEPIGLANYGELVIEDRFQNSMQNLLIFTVAFIGGTMLIGLIMAVLLERGIKGEGFFRSAFIFPMALSFIASGLVWGFLMNPNVDDNAGGLNWLLKTVGLGALQNPWWQTNTWGMSALALPAIWMFSGYIMALFLAGFRGIPDDVREAARIDGANEFQIYTKVLFPLLGPAALSALVILGHISVKVFDLVVAVSFKQYRTETPAVYMWVTTFDATNFGKGAAIASILLIVTAVIVVPYLVSVYKGENRK
jgi:glucose/mannose transport system permease protein